MQLGWIDFSKNERKKVLDVLNMLSEPGTLDELGIAPIRDGFANIFFPGTSTIQTRAKYFMIIPYILKDLEYSNETDCNTILRKLDDIECRCGKTFLNNGGDTSGIIGIRSLKQNSWVKRAPSSIYWSGLRTYGIFTNETFSLYQYVRKMCKLKKQKINLKKLGNRHDNAEEGNLDDKDAGNPMGMRFWKIPTYKEKWEKNLNIKLSKDEGEFLKKQIITSCPNSMLAYILQNRKAEICKYDSFQSLDEIIHSFPKQIRDDYAIAYDFSSFLYVLRTIYNILVSGGKNTTANSEWSKLKGNLKNLSALDLEKIFIRLRLSNFSLRQFLRKSKKLMADEDLEGMKTEIIRREVELKQSRAKTKKPGEFDVEEWFGGGELDYRFNNAKVIIRDIFESEGLYA